jgi:archaeal type IV pilus assembly protein PilA
MQITLVSQEKRREYMKQQNEWAVSPVVGVMLMLVVVIIIAAVVSGFAGGLVNGKNQKTPQLAMDAQIVNTGYWSSSYFKAVVTGVDSTIKTRDLKLVTTWSKTLSNGTTVNGGASVIPGVSNFKVLYNTHSNGFYDTWQNVVPQGYGPGVGLNGTITMNGAEFSNFWPVEGNAHSMAELNAGTGTNYSWFGNYHLQAGTIMFARPFGGKLGGQATGTTAFAVGYGLPPNSTASIGPGGKYYYAYGIDPSGTSGATLNQYPDSVDQMQAVLGNNWNLLRSGDIITMKVIYTPSGKTIWQKDISVEG